MQLVGQAVKHISFGKGIVTGLSSDGSIISILFSKGEKRFFYPEAFVRYLTLKDAEKQKKITAKYNQQLQAEEANWKAECEEQERRRQLKNIKILPNSQAAFHVSIDDFNETFESGRISTGCYLSGHSKGEPRIPNRLKPNSGCMLTGIPKGGQEKDRLILGAFMVAEDFLGEYCHDGFVNVHETHRILLPLKFALPYWDYFENDGVFPRWGNIPFKYFSNSIMQQVLLQITSLFAETEKEEIATAFYQYFCRINHLSVS